MKVFRQTILVTFLLTIFFISSCNSNKEKELQPRLPIAKNSYSIASNDSFLFSISIRDSSIFISDYFSNIQIKDSKFIGDFVCEEVKKGKINIQRDLPVNILLDSLTPFSIYDKLTEELKLLDINAGFLRTSKHGFKIVFSENNFDVLEELVKLYGQRFTKRRYLLHECVDIAEKISINDDFIPPPPPPPPPPPSYYFKILKNLDSLDILGLGLLEKHGNVYILNGRTYKINELCLGIDKKEILFIKLNQKNTYNDLIRMIDLLKSLEIKRFDYYSKMKFTQDYSHLNEEQKMEIKKEHCYKYAILSLADQNYIDNN